MTTAPRVKKTVAYMRVSTPGQKDALAAQRQSITKWATANEVHIDEWYEEIVSGKSELHKRPELVRALGRLGKGDRLVIVRRDRLARNIVTAAISEKMVAKVGASIVATDGGDFGDGPEGVLLRTIIDAIGEYERMLIIARIRAGTAAKKMRGEALSDSAPYGKRVLAIEGATTPGGRPLKLLVDEPKEIPIVEFILALHAKGTSHRRILAATIEAGHRNRVGNCFTLLQIQRILAANGLVEHGARSPGAKGRQKPVPGRKPGRPKKAETAPEPRKRRLPA